MDEDSSQSTMKLSGTNMKKLTTFSFLALGLYVGISLYSAIRSYDNLDLDKS